MTTQLNTIKTKRIVIAAGRTHLNGLATILRLKDKPKLNIEVCTEVSPAITVSRIVCIKT